MIHIGTRASPLAQWQANWVAEQLRAGGVDVELVPITTAGDRDQQGPIGAIGTSGVFTKELQRALLDGRIDLAVHSLKDLPTENVAGLLLAAVPTRESPSDALLSRGRLPLAELPPAAKVGTGSLRRQSQLLHARPDLQVSEIRGNVETRVRKLHEGEYDALVLAEAGLKRLGLEAEIVEILPKSLMLPAIGQGALGLETRADDPPTLAAVARLDDEVTHAAVLAERSLLATLRGGCLAPVGAWGRVEQDGNLRLTATVLSRDGRQRLIAEGAEPTAMAVELGRRIGEELLAQGAATLIALSRAAL
ncbi:MAG: hydroxymethylbilane synthase [Pirellulales bacterium]